LIYHVLQVLGANGNSYIPFVNPKVISYLPNDGFFGTTHVFTNKYSVTKGENQLSVDVNGLLKGV